MLLPTLGNTFEAGISYYNITHTQHYVNVGQLIQKQKHRNLIFRIARVLFQSFLRST